MAGADAPGDEPCVMRGAVWIRGMSIEVLKQELAGLGEKERAQIMAYLLTLQDGQDGGSSRDDGAKDR